MSYETSLAVVGMSARVPGASGPVQFWKNLCAGVKSIRGFSEKELLVRGVDAELLRNPNYVRAGTTLEDLENFDAGFFGYTPREAEIMDPQLRLFLECAYEALEDAGCDPERNKALTGVFAGSAMSSYLHLNLVTNREVMELMGLLQVGILNSHDSLASTIAYKFNFKGPSVAVQTFCSTSLVSVHMACQSLLNFECDMALAGGVAVTVPHGHGYVYQEGGILSPDGECRTFDAGGKGSVMGSGAGIVVLKRAEDAIAQNDHIYAIIRGSAVNNDGRARVGYTAPGLEGQTEIISEAMAHAGVDADSIGYVEAHGTATSIGDAIEMAAMIRAFRKRTQKKRYCAIGSVKPNVGHLDRAAGVTGLIKTVLALENRQLPPSLNFKSASAEIDLENSPFYVNTELREWKSEGPRRAGVSSFGLGGTNAHVVLEEAPAVEPVDEEPGPQLLIMSAKTATALEKMAQNLAGHLAEHPELSLRDVAWTLQVGRTEFNHRRFLVCADREGAIARLRKGEGESSEQKSRDRAVRLPGGEAGEWLREQGVKGSEEGELVEVKGSLLEVLGRLWLKGVTVEWKTGGRRVSLPAYPFERKRYWLDAPRAEVAAAVAEPAAARGGKRSDIGEWFYRAMWERASLGEQRATGKWVVLGGGAAGAEVAARLQAAGCRVERTLEGELPAGIVHLGSMAEVAEAGGVDRFRAMQQVGFYSVLEAAKELGRRMVDEPVEMVVVRGAEAGQATVAGLCRVMGQENVTLRCRCVEVEKVDAEVIAEECLRGSKARSVAYRGAERWEEHYAPVRLEEVGAKRWREGGVYLLVGGRGAVGEVIAKHIVERVKGRVAILSRRAAEEKATEARMVLQADAADRRALGEAVAKVRQQWGRIDGVLHLAGVSESNAFGPLQELSAEQCERHFRAKAEAVYALEEALGEEGAEWCVLFSSLSAVLGGLGFGGYAAANSFLDAYAEQRRGDGWISVNWDTWKVREGSGEGLGSTVARYEMEAGEALEALERVLGCGEKRVVNSTGDLEERIREWVELESVRGEESAPNTPGGGDYEERIAGLWRQVLGIEQVGLHENFFDLGGNSLIGLQLIARMKKEFKRAIPAVALFEAPTVSALAGYLRPEGEKEEDRQEARLAARRRQRARGVEGGEEIAIIGMAGRFPGADTVEEFWENLRGGVESLTYFSDEELLASGVEAELVQDANYVKARPVLRDVEQFDAGLFGYTPREAEMMDPQQRLFQECAWEALERAGYDSLRYAGLIGVFGGTNLNSYLMRLSGDPQIAGLVGDATVLENDKDALTMNVSYRLNLRGPSVAVQTFCSTSLVATHLACRSLRNGECDVALAGGVSVRVPVKAGYLYQEGDQASHDGHCRTFDEAADGTMFGDGVAMVVLKRLGDAVHDGDTIHAVIKGSAVNNDGGFKVGYAAPSVVGQSAVVMAALADAGVSAESIEYVEAHGTATKLGDPIEVASLTKAFRSETEKRGYCAIGSVKPNVGHLDRAAGVTGLIKTVLALEHEELPGTLHYRKANAEIDFERSPFYVNTELRGWKGKGRPRRACVNSLGVGGTNAHVVVEEAPAMGETGPTRGWQALVMSGRSEGAVERVGEELRRWLEEHEEAKLGDVAYTLQVGRRAMEHRRVVMCRTREEAIGLLGGKASRQVLKGVQKAAKRSVAFVFGGVGEQAGGLGKELYREEAVFRSAVDRCSRILGRDMGEVLFGGKGVLRKASEAQVGAFVLDWALGQMWLDWGIRPGAVMGYSVGEYVAACVAGVMSVEDGLGLVARRGEWIEESAPRGAMLAVTVGEGEVGEWLRDGVELSAVNSPAACVLGGSEEAIGRLERELEKREIACRRVETNHAYHTSQLRVVEKRVKEYAGKVKLSAPRIGCVSNVTGRWLTAGEATDGGYWAEQMCRTVRFEEGVGALLEGDGQVVLEVGAGGGLSSFVRQHAGCGRERMGSVVSSLGGMQEGLGEQGSMVAALGRMWLLDVGVDWEKYYAGERRRRIVLPTYPFERKRYWIQPSGKAAAVEPRKTQVRKPDVADWFYLPVWTPAAVESPKTTLGGVVLLFADHDGLASRLAARLERDATVIRVQAGDRYARPHPRVFHLRPAVREDYETILKILSAEGKSPAAVVHAWSLSAASHSFDACQERGLYSVMALAQALGEQVQDASIPLIVITDSAQPAGGETLNLNQAPLAGACKVFGQEYLGLRCRNVDISAAGETSEGALFELLAAELASGDEALYIAYRAGVRLVQRFVDTRLPVPENGTRLRQRGVYLILGGTGGIGSRIAEYLARTAQARLILVSRKGPGAHLEARLRSIEAAGGEVFLAAADLGDAAQLRAAIEQGEARFGPLNGVVHTAGNVDPAWFLPIRDSGREQCECHFDAKVRGLYALEAILGDRPLDFCFLFSSISSILGGLGYLGYTAANCFMDAFAHQHSRISSVPWTTINWDTWKLKASQQPGAGATVAQYELSPSEGLDAFARVLGSEAVQIINSTGDLNERFRQWVQLESVRAGASDTTPTAPGTGSYEQRIAALWRCVLGVEHVGIYDNFFDLGGNSLIALQLVAQLRKEFKRSVPAVALFEAPTVNALADYLRPEGAVVEDRETQRLAERRERSRGTVGGGEIAIIGMAGRFPGAASVEDFWRNLRDGVVALTHFTDEELMASGVEPAMIHDPNYVKSRYIVNDVDLFDAELFGYSPREAEVMDPQQRLFQECAWEALERAGYDSLRYPGLIGVFGGTNLNGYLMRLAGDPLFHEILTESMVLENEKDALTMNVSYRLNLRGPSLAVQTFCSTSLVATHLACRSLRNGESDMALAGGVSIRVPTKIGYLYREGGQESRDACCRSFDSCADGTVWADGVAMVVLKRLGDAVHDGDTIHAVIKGSAVNNDGGFKVGYAAPSVVGQSAVVMAALADAGVSAESIEYVEAHGTATKLGDPIEVASLTKAFRSETEKRGYCAIGSVKPNVGHLDRAAGVTGLIKTVLALEHEELPGTLHYRKANAEIDFERSPFYVNTELRGWKGKGRPRRACVNSLGVGGTNAHVVVEEAPAMGETGPTRGWQALVMSGRSEGAVERVGEELRRWLEEHEEAKLGDVAYTLQVGRRAMEHRRVVMCRTREEAIGLLGGKASRQVLKGVQKAAKRSVAFVFGGVGEQAGGLGKELYREEAVFRSAVDRCSRILGRDMGEVLFGGKGVLRKASEAQVGAFVLDWALGQMWLDWGIRPGAVMGYSVGEYVAACVAGVMSVEDGLGLVARRGEWIEESAPRGAMLAVTVGEGEVGEWLRDGVELSAVNSPAACVLGGSEEAIGRLERELEKREIACRRVETNHAYHTSQLRVVEKRVKEYAGKVKLSAPRIGCVSNVTGRWLTAGEATDGGYWAEQMCRTVRFEEGVGALLEGDGQVVLEVGAGGGLSSFVRQHAGCGRERMGSVVSSLGGMQEGLGEQGSMVAALGRMWLLDVGVDWEKYYAGERRRRIVLPTYPFERKRYWIEPSGKAAARSQAAKKTDVSEWFSVDSWKRSAGVEVRWPETRENWLLLMDGGGAGTQLARLLAEHDQEVVTVAPGAVRAGERADYDTLLQRLSDEGKLPHHVVHLWMLDREEDTERVLERGFYSLLALVQAMGDRGVERCRVDVVTSGMQEVTGSEQVTPGKAAVMGPCRIIPQEYPNLSARSIDVDEHCEARVLMQELLRGEDDEIALRGRYRWVKGYEGVRLESGAETPLRDGGVYLITGGMGGIGQAIARALVEKVKARLVLVGRRLRRVELGGAEVLTVEADVADEAQIARAVRLGVERFGRIDGVFHTAGVPGVGLMQLKSAEAARGVLRPKVQGTERLWKALEGRALDFAVVFSSVTSATGGGPGQADYCAANAYTDAWARREQKAGRRVVSISWGEWQWDAWSEGLQGFPEETRRYLIANRRCYGIGFEEGMEALWRVMASGLPHVFVTTQDLNAMAEGSRKSSAASAIQKLEEQRSTRQLYPRPNLASSYIAPASEWEKKIAALWSQALGIDPIGVDDNFFDLGGNSLVGIDLVGRLRKDAGSRLLPAHILYECPTVGSLARHLDPNAPAVAAAEIFETDLALRQEKRQEQLDLFRKRAFIAEPL